MARRLMRRLHAIVGVALGRVSHVAEASSDRGRVASQSVGDDAQRFSSLPAQKPAEEPLCSASITSRLHQDVDYVAVLIDRTPEILQFSVDSKEDLVQMPVVAEPALSSLQLANHSLRRTSDTTAGPFHRLRGCLVPPEEPRRLES